MATRRAKLYPIIRQYITVWNEAMDSLEAERLMLRN